MEDTFPKGMDNKIGEAGEVRRLLQIPLGRQVAAGAGETHGPGDPDIKAVTVESASACADELELLANALLIWASTNWSRVCTTP